LSRRGTDVSCTVSPFHRRSHVLSGGEDRAVKRRIGKGCGGLRLSGDAGCQEEAGDALLGGDLSAWRSNAPEIAVHHACGLHKRLRTALLIADAQYGLTGKGGRRKQGKCAAERRAAAQPQAWHRACSRKSGSCAVISSHSG
jgi:hypothetical protein